LYYDGRHDILDKDFRRVTVYKERDEYADGYENAPFDEMEVVVNNNNANHRNVHNYYAELVDQETDYVVGITPSVTVEGAGTMPDEGAANPLKNFENEITAFTSDERFLQKLADTIVEARGKAGVAYWHLYYTPEGNLDIALCPTPKSFRFMTRRVRKSWNRLSGTTQSRML
jgi:hypothetical protein